MEEENKTEPIVNMENDSQPKKQMFSNKGNSNIIIVVLVVLLILSLLGVNLFMILGGALQSFFDILKTYILKLLTVLGFYTGAVINTSADIVGDTAKETIDIAEGTVQSVGHLLQNRNNMGGQSLEQQQFNMNVFDINATPVSGDFAPAITPSASEMSVSSMQSKTENKLNSFNDKVTNFVDNIKEKKSLLQQLNQEINVKEKQLASLPGDSPSDANMKWCPVGYENGSGLCTEINKDDKCMYGKTFSSKEKCENDVSKPMFSGYSSQNNSVNWGMPPPPPPCKALTPPMHSRPCNELPGMCINQKPICGPGKSLPIQMQTIPSRGQIQSNGKTQGQQQMETQMPQQNQLPPLPTFDNQTNPFVGNQPNTSSPDPSPVDSSNPFNQNNTPAGGTSSMIIAPAPQNAAPAFPVSLTPATSVSPSPSLTPGESQKSPESQPVSPGQHHHHPHSHTCDGSPTQESPVANTLTPSISPSPAVNGSPVHSGDMNHLKQSIAQLTDAINKNTKSMYEEVVEEKSLENDMNNVKSRSPFASSPDTFKKPVSQLDDEASKIKSDEFDKQNDQEKRIDNMMMPMM